MKKTAKSWKIFGLIILTLLILTIIPASGIIINNQFEKENEINDKLSIWKPYSCCFILGGHFGEVAPEPRIGPAALISIGYGSHNINIFGLKGRRTISELKGFGFVGIIDYYSTPRVPALIIGFILFCFYK